jgi:hypothetical protein
VGGIGVLGGAACVAAICYGFGAAGIVGGSSAAALQASIGSVVAGSAFAMMQSLGATGWFVTGAYAGAATAGVGGVTAVTTAALHGNKEKALGKETKGDEYSKPPPDIKPGEGADS